MTKFVEAAGSLTNTTASLPAKERQGLIVGNPSDTVMTLRFGATASATAGVPVAAGDVLALMGRNAPSDSVSLFCAWDDSPS